MDLCECGCGEAPRPGNRYIRGHSGNKFNSQRVGEENHRWKGGRTVQPNGYVEVVVPDDHPRASMAWKKKAGQRRCLEHRIVMAEYLGRDLCPGESVHHKNGVRSDNRIENLELRVSHPAGQTPADLTAWARVILERYGDAAAA